VYRAALGGCWRLPYVVAAGKDVTSSGRRCGALLASQQCHRPIEMSHTNDDPIAQQVIHFTSDFVRVPQERITYSTTLYGDLGMDGDDAVEFFQEFQARFQVDLSAFDFMRHFHEEGRAVKTVCGQLQMLWSWLLRRTPMMRRQFQPITVGQLIGAAKARKW
jgi:acyl carrier protein